MARSSEPQSVRLAKALTAKRANTEPIKIAMASPRAAWDPELGPVPDDVYRESVTRLGWDKKPAPVKAVIRHDGSVVDAGTGDVLPES